MEHTNGDSFSDPGSEVDFDAAMNELKLGARWMKFLAIVGFVFLGLLAIGALLFLAVPNAGPVASLVMFIVDIVLFFGVRYLFLYATKLQKYEDAGKMEDLEDAFQHQKSMWMYQGILLIVYLVVAGIVIAYASQNINRMF